MTSKFAMIAKIESILLILLAVSMIPSLLIAIFNNETNSMYAFIITILICTTVGVITRLRFKLSRYNLKNRDGFLIVSLSWFLISFLGAFPFWISGGIPNFVDALFESCSGFSTTGASILTNIEVLPKSLLFWRSFIQWLGGLGILVFLTAIAPAFAIDGESLYDGETSAPKQNKLTSHFSDYSKQIYMIYFALTIIEIILLKIVGLSLFDSTIHTFGTVSTSGFSSYNASIGHFDNAFVKILTIIFMFFAALNINLYFLAKKRGFKEVLKDEETRFFFTVTLGACLIVSTYNFIFNGFKNLGETILNGFFQVVSIITTTGYMTDDYNLWPTFTKFIILLLFFIGGCSSSTAGGIKCVRIYGALKLILRGIYSRLHPNIISPVTFNGKEMSNVLAIKIANFIFTYMVLIAGGTIILSINGFDFMTNFSTAISCLGNIGPGFNLVGPALNYSIFNDFSKLVCSFLMITGRLELYTVLVLFSRNYWNPNKLR